MSIVSKFLEGWQPETDFCKEVDITPRTCQRYRLQESPGLPYTIFGGKVYIHIEDGREWLRHRVRQHNVVAA